MPVSSPPPLKDIFAEALRRTEPADRSAYLAAVCPDPCVRERVEALLRASEDPNSLLGAGPALTLGAESQGHIPVEPTAAHQPGFVPGVMIAHRYKLLEQIGAGGMGAVWMAEQREPVKRLVAVKLIKPGMDSQQVLARFEAERQALALMDHPNIAKVLDGGLHEHRPFFVMELVKGVPITKYCDQCKLTPRQRLELFVPVCQAIQHAHQKGIIHRDIKPSNVLIALYDDKPVVKVIDFGVAKATGGTLTEQTIVTGFGGIVGTPEYMSPEQATFNNLDIDTRADVYSLGVLLYELLTGTPPFSKKELEKRGLLEMLRVVREEEPPRPSTKLSTSDALPTLSANRGTEPKKLTGLLRNELDWIVMKALEKDRARRYETANGFGRDVERYLLGDVVHAHPPSTGYRLKKFGRRHKGQVLAAGIIVGLLAAGIVGTSIGLVQARRAQRSASASASAAEAAQQQAMEALRVTTDEVVEKLLSAKPELGPDEKEFLESTLKRWQSFAAQQGESVLARRVRAEGLRRVAYLRQKLGQNEEARAGYQQAIAGYAQLAADFPAVPHYSWELAGSQHNLGILLADLGQRAEAEAAYRQALAIYEKLAADYPAGPLYRQYLADNHNSLGALLRDLGRRAEAEAAFRQALAIHEKLVADFPAVPQYRMELATSHLNLGVLLKDLGQRADAEAAYRQALAIYEKLTTDYPTVPQYRLALASSNLKLGSLLKDLDQRVEAEAAYRQALAIHEKLTAEYPAVPQYRLQLGRSHGDLGVLLDISDRRPEAEVAYRHALGIFEKLVAEYRAVPPYRLELAITRHNLGLLFARLHKRVEAEAAYRQALAIQEKLVADYPAVPQYRLPLANIRQNLAILLIELGRDAQAEADYREALAIREKLVADFPAIPEYRIALAGSQCFFAYLHCARKQPDEALPWCDRAIAGLEEVLRQVKVDVTARQYLRGAHVGRAKALDDLKRHPEAIREWDKVIELAPEAEKARFHMRRALSHVRGGQVDAAIQETEALPKNADAVTLYDAVCVLALAAGRPDEAGGSLSKEECARRAMALLQQAVARGYKDAEHLKKDDDLKALRQRDDFKKLVAELETKLQK